MQRKIGATTREIDLLDVVSEEPTAAAGARVAEVRALAGSTPELAARLTAEEERVVRMRTGSGLPRSATLQRLATASDTDIELLSYEIEAYLKLKERGLSPRARRAPASGGASAPRAAAPGTSRTKDKIVRALRKKS